MDLRSGLIALALFLGLSVDVLSMRQLHKNIYTRPILLAGASSAGRTYYWGSHQIGESVLALDQDTFHPEVPNIAEKQIFYPKAGFGGRITYIECYINNEPATEEVYIMEGGVGSLFVKLFIGTSAPTTFLEYKVTVYGFDHAFS